MWGTGGKRGVTARLGSVGVVLAVLGLALPASVAAAPAGGERWLVQLAQGTDPQTVLGPARVQLGMSQSTCIGTSFAVLRPG